MWKTFTKDEKVMIVVLAAINFLNYIDRQIVFPLFHHIQVDFGLTDFQLGLIGTAFVVGYAATVIPLGVLADKFVRKTIIFWGVLLWSLMTFFSGLAQGFKSLLSLRTLVGVGEASYAPAATAMIADNFPQEKRARVQGLFHLGMYIGGTLGAMIGATIVFFTDSWRLAFFIVAIPGFLLAALALLLKDKQIVARRKKVSLVPLFKNPGYVLVLVGGSFAAFTTSGYVSWGVEYIRRFSEYTLLEAAIYLGVATIVAGTLGILIGSNLADKWHTHNPGGRSWVIGLSTLMAIPFLLWGFNTPTNSIMFVVLFGIGITFMSFYFGPVAAVIQDIVPSNIRATAFATYVFVIHLLGGATAPALVGKWSDMYDLNIALQITTLFEVVAGITFLVIGWLIHKRVIAHESIADVHVEV